MYRRIAAASLLACAASVSAYAAELPAGDSPGFTLIRNGLTGSGNQLAKGPAIAITADDVAVTLDKTTLTDIVATLGGEVHREGEGGGLISWLCYASYISPDGPPQLVWFASKQFEDPTLPVTNVAIEFANPPEGCFTMASDLKLATGALTVGATQAELEAAYGAKPEVDPDGTIAWFFGAEKVGDGINLRTSEIKYNVVDGKAIAASVGKFYEME